MPAPDPMEIDNQTEALEASPNDRILRAIEAARDEGRGFSNYDSRGNLRLVDFFPLQEIVASVTDHELLDDLVVWSNAYKSRDFSHILFPPPAIKSSSISPSASHDTLHSAFTGPYIGDYHEVFVETLDEYISQGNKPSTTAPYSMSISVIQSSGMGKSRMIQEASTLVFTIPINIREDLSSGLATYPPPDKSVREYFSGDAEKSDKRLQVEYAIFLEEMFRHTSVVIADARFEESEHLPIDWAEYLVEGQSTLGVGNNREQFFGTIVKNAKTRLEVFPAEVDDKTVTEVTGSLERKCQSFLDVIKSRTKRDRMVCMVAFDEAHSLTSPRTQPDDHRSKSPYHNLEKVLTYIRGEPIFFVFLSTNSSLHRFAPTKASHPSARSIHTEGNYFFPPFTELPFDIYSKRYLSSHKPLTLEKMCTIEAMSVFGRGLWHNHYRERKRLMEEPVQTQAPGKIQTPLESLLKFASDKLFLDNGSDGSTAKLAALGIRLGLTFNPSTVSGRKLESALVESYMRVATAIPTHREFMRTHAPSEPILAEAAGRGCNVIQDGLPLLSRYFGDGALARGERGEAFGRMLWTGAHDEALESQARPQGFTGTRFHLPVKVINLLKSMFHPDLHDMILKAKPLGNPDGPELQDAFQNSFVFFSHFARAKNQDMLRVDKMYTGLVRGMAFYGKANQRSIDAVIPIHMGKTTDKISPRTTSAINIQFKNRDDCRNVYIDRSITIPNDQTPALSVIMHLGDPREDSRSTLERVVVQNPKDIPPKVLSSDSYPEGRDDHHYSIVVYGHGPRVYNVIREDQKAACDQLLAMGNLSQDFPRSKQKRNVRVMHRTKPFFDGGPKSDTFDWIEREDA